MKLSELLKDYAVDEPVPGIRATVKESKEGKTKGNAWVYVYDEPGESEDLLKILLKGNVFPTEKNPLPSDSDEILISPDKRGNGITVTQGKESVYYTADERAEVQITTANKIPDRKNGFSAKEAAKKSKEEKTEVQSTEIPQQEFVDQFVRPLTHQATKWLDERVELYNSVEKHVRSNHPHYPESAIPPLATSLYLEFSRSPISPYLSEDQERRSKKTGKEVGVKGQLKNGSADKKQEAKPIEDAESKSKSWKEVAHPTSGKLLGKTPTEEIAKNTVLRWYYQNLHKKIKDETTREYHEALGHALGEKIGNEAAQLLQYVENAVTQHTNKVKEQVQLTEKLIEKLTEEAHYPSDSDNIQINPLRMNDAFVRTDELIDKLTGE